MPVERREKTARPVPILGDGLESPPLGRGELLRANPCFADIFDEGKTDVHILIVADGIISFVEAEFGLSELINKALYPSAMPWEGLTIVKAHRANDAKGADVHCFRFDMKPPPPYDRPLSYYDQIWLFGYESEKDNKGNPNQFILSDAELRELSNFMNAGGGVFATGDHEDLGAALCGRVPRVGSMRKWFLKDSPPPRNGVTRIDTLREGIDQGFLTNDQADNIPQEIRPIFKLNAVGDNSFPHCLLRKDEFAITVLPDHMHEGECVIPKDLTAEITLDDGTKFKEYPPKHNQAKSACDKDERLSPEVVAISTSAGGFVGDEIDPTLPVIPRCYNVIVAYDGHQACKASDEYEKEMVGRVVVDASFHHFVDINLRGTGSGDAKKKGLYDASDNPTKDYLAIKQYYRNIVRWLCPPEKQASYYLNLFLTVRYLSPLVEEIRPVVNPRWEDLMFAGGATRRAITERFSQSDAIQCARFVAGALSSDLKAVVEMLFDPWEASASPLSPAHTVFNLDLILKLILGGAMLGIAAGLPGDPCAVNSVLSEGKARHEQFQSFICGGLLQAREILSQVITQSHSILGTFSEAFNAFTGPVMNGQP